MSTVVNKFQAGTAACAIAAATVVAPAVVAQASPASPAPAAPITELLGQNPFVGPGNLAQDFNWWWFGSPNGSPPARTTITTFNALPLIPGFLRPAASQLNAEVCVAGLGVRVGAYGRVTASVGRGC